MPKDTILATPIRRSKRFQPLATPSGKPTTKLDCFWTSSPIYTRTLNTDLDLLQDERDELSEDDVSNLETRFYDALNMGTQKYKIYRGAKKRVKIEEKREVYEVGDTILVETDVLYRVRRPPSVAVIVAMWECRDKNGVGEEVDSNKMRIRVHWFLRPTEMASIRAKREHTQVRKSKIQVSCHQNDG